ncbi:hypothetical protein ABEY01_03300 [Bacillus velezensis]|nr:MULTISPECIES: hypothetical protein [Bacillus]MBT0952692.1 hypothetical protein [Bacillus velezensis]MCD7913438.1 hypothetical protein [Bacillus velezensis]MCQ9194767.1 hypothetical protein [Bacillus velezensis]MCX2917840.1 hypothetical protein [Bacillus velezensis]MCY6276734.1 hypothetical protein [Bacillus sp. NEAU-16]
MTAISKKNNKPFRLVILFSPVITIPRRTISHGKSTILVVIQKKTRIF